MQRRIKRTICSGAGERTIFTSSFSSRGIAGMFSVEAGRRAGAGAFLPSALLAGFSQEGREEGKLAS